MAVAVGGVGSKNSPLSTASTPDRFVNVINTFPLTAHFKYTPELNDDTVSVLSTVPVTALLSVTLSLRLVVSQSTK